MVDELRRIGHHRAVADSEPLELGLLWDEAPELVRPEYEADLSIEERFQLFHSANPWVFAALVRLAKDLRNRGHRRFGVKLLFERLRYEYLVTTTDEHSPWRLNNNMTSRYARLIIENVPELADCFEIRELRAA